MESDRSQLGLESEPARTEDGAGSDWRRSLLGLESELARIEEGACSDLNRSWPKNVDASVVPM